MPSSSLHEYPHSCAYTHTPTYTQFKVSLFFFFLSEEFIESRVKGREERKRYREEEEEGLAYLFNRAAGTE